MHGANMKNEISNLELSFSMGMGRYVGITKLVVHIRKFVNVSKMNFFVHSTYHIYRSADKSLARPASRCVLFDGENISFDDSLVIYINSNNIPPIMIINRI
jgi:hypothetical protein